MGKTTVHNLLQRAAGRIKWANRAKQLSSPKIIPLCFSPSPFPFVPPLSLHPPSDFPLSFSHFPMPLFSPPSCSSWPPLSLLSPSSLRNPNCHMLPQSSVLSPMLGQHPLTSPPTRCTQILFFTYKTSKAKPTWRLLILPWSLILMNPYLFPKHPGHPSNPEATAPYINCPLLLCLHHLTL